MPDRLESTLFTEDNGKDVSETPQCNQDGILNCIAVTVQDDLLLNQLIVGESVKFLPGVDISLMVGQDISF